MLITAALNARKDSCKEQSVDRLRMKVLETRLETKLQCVAWTVKLSGIDPNVTAHFEKLDLFESQAEQSFTIVVKRFWQLQSLILRRCWICAFQEK